MLETASSPQGSVTSPNSHEKRSQVDFVAPELKPIGGLSSYIYEGIVRHRRNRHARNHFKFSVFYFLLDLDELDVVFNKHWLWSTRRRSYGSFRRSDYLKEFSAERPLKQCAVDLLEKTGVETQIGKVRLLTQLRYCGFQMNPVSFYYCYDTGDQNVVAVIVEVNNTPWGEQHIYVVRASEPAKKLIVAQNVQKTFHVSPFMEMGMHYRMLLSHPGEKIGIKMENHQHGEKVFDVSLSLGRKPLNSLELAKVVAKYPLYSFKVFAGIYFQALKLYIKRVPFVPHP